MTSAVKNENLPSASIPTHPVKEVDTPWIRLNRKNGIITGRFAENLEMDLDIAVHCVKHRIELCEGIPYPLLADMRGIRSISKEAREYLANQGSQLVKAGALLVGSWLTSTLANVFLAINKPKVPTRMFTDEVEAMGWLEKYK